MNHAPCPRCGASVRFAKRPAIGTCAHCQTFLVYAGGTTLPARTFSRGSMTDGAFALVCNLCGGPLPAIDPTSKVLARGGTMPGRIVCEYCDHDADLPPTALAVLRLLITKPSVAPPAVASLGRAWLSIGGVAVAVIGVAIARGADRTTLRGDVKGDDLPWKSSELEVNARAGRFPSLTITNEDAGTTQQCVKVSFVDVGRSVTRSDWVMLNGGSGTFLFGEASFPAGTYRIQLDAFEGEASTPRSLHVELDTLPGGPWGWLILMANVLIWALVLDLRWTKGSLTRSPTRSRVVRILALVAIAALAVETLHPLEDGPGELAPKKVGKAPAWCRGEDS